MRSQQQSVSASFPLQSHEGTVIIRGCLLFMEPECRRDHKLVFAAPLPAGERIPHVFRTFGNGSVNFFFTPQ